MSETKCANCEFFKFPGHFLDRGSCCRLPPVDIGGKFVFPQRKQTDTCLHFHAKTVSATPSAPSEQ